MTEPQRYTIFTKTTHELRGQPDYVITYEAFLDNKLEFRWHYRAKFGAPTNSSIEDCSQASNIDVAVSMKVGGIQVSLCEKQQTISILDGLQIMSSDKQVLLRASDPSSLGKAFVRSALGGDPCEHNWLSPDEERIAATMREHKIKKRLPWPLSIPEAILKAVLNKGQRPKYFLLMQQAEVSPVCLFAHSVLIDAAKNRGV